MEDNIDHKLKIYPSYYEDVVSGVKTFEIRINDRNFNVGHTVRLQEALGGEYTGREIDVEIVYVTGYDQQEGYVVFGFKKITKDCKYFVAYSWVKGGDSGNGNATVTNSGMTVENYLTLSQDIEKMLKEEHGDNEIAITSIFKLED